MRDVSAANARLLAVPNRGREVWRTAGRYLELGKARLSALVLVTTAVGFVLAEQSSIDWGRLALTVLGTGLAALGANALNEWWERERDARMCRTAGRPLPTRRLTPRAALLFGLACGSAGPLILLFGTTPLAAALALLTLLTYVLLYTPLKVRTTGNTLVGAVVGALPPLVGWTAATGGIAPAALALAATLFCWQVPHFLALAWLYREDYQRGGFRMLPTVDPAGHLTACIVVVYALLLLPVTLALTVLGAAGWLYAGGALVLGAAFVAVAVALERQRTAAAARGVFLASVIYLPLLMGLLVLDRPARSAARPTAAVAAPVERAADVAA